MRIASLAHARRRSGRPTGQTIETSSDGKTWRMSVESSLPQGVLTWTSPAFLGGCDWGIHASAGSTSAISPLNIGIL